MKLHAKQERKERKTIYRPPGLVSVRGERCKSYLRSVLLHASCICSSTALMPRSHRLKSLFFSWRQRPDLLHQVQSPRMTAMQIHALTRNTACVFSRFCVFWQFVQANTVLHVQR